MGHDKRTPAKPYLWCALLALAGLAAYGNSFRGPFILDDTASIVDNPSIRHLWPPWDALRPPHDHDQTVAGRPILNLSLAVNYAISGTGVWSYHALNLLIHLLAGLTLFGIVRRTLQTAAPARRIAPRDEGGPGSARWTEASPTLLAYTVALLWTVHPLQTEAVTYVIQRAESLMGLFYLLTLYGFIRGTESNEAGRRLRPRGLALSVGACLLAMGTKEVAVTLPVMVLLYDRTFVSGGFREAWRVRRRYYLGLAATWLLLAGLGASLGGSRGGMKGFGTGVSWWAWDLTQFEAIGHYLRLAVWPEPLVFSYGPFWIGAAEAAPFAGLVLLLVAATGYAFFRRSPSRQSAPLRPGFGGGIGGRALGFLGVFFFGILAVTSIPPGANDMIAERRMYLPLAAVIVPAVLALVRWLGRGGYGLCLVLAFGCGALTWRRNLDYRSEGSIWSDTAAKRPRNPYAQYSAGVLLAEQGRLAEAVARYREAVRLQPNFVEARQSLANALFQQGNAAEALRHFQAALAVRPDDAGLHFDFGTVLFQTGAEPAAAIQFGEALRLRPDYAEAHDNLGILLAKAGRLPEAIFQFQEALRVDPGSIGAHHNLGLALAAVGRQGEADVQLEWAARLGQK